MDAIQEYLDFHHLRGSSPRHVGEVERILRCFEKALQKPVIEAKKSDCSAYLRKFQIAGRKPSTLFAYHTALTAFYSWLVREEYLTTSPMKNIPSETLPKEQVKPFSPEELVRLIDQADPSTFIGARDRLLMMLMADTGLRVSEVLSIRCKDINRTEKSITVMGKGSKERTVFFGQSVEKALRTYLKKRGEGKSADVLIVNSLGEKFWRFAVTERIRDYGRKAGIEGKRCSSHTLRHTCGATWIKNGGDVLSLQRLLGHATPTMTMKYVLLDHTDLSTIHKAVSPIDRLTIKDTRERQRRLR